MSHSHRYRVMRTNRHAAARRQYLDEVDLLRWTHGHLGDDVPEAVRVATKQRQATQTAIEAAAALSGLLGAFLLAGKGDYAAWGWLAFLASNAGWIGYAWIRRAWWLMAQQLGFTATSLLGIWRWLL